MSYIVEKFKKKYAGDHIIFRNHPVLHKIAVCLIYSFIFGLVFASAYKLLYPATGFLTLVLILLAYTFGSTVIAFFGTILFC